MDVLLSRILKYLNGALSYDDDYKFCTYIVEHYLEIEHMQKKPAPCRSRNPGIQPFGIYAPIAGYLPLGNFPHFICPRPSPSAGSNPGQDAGLKIPGPDSKHGKGYV